MAIDSEPEIGGAYGASQLGAGILRAGDLARGGLSRQRIMEMARRGDLVRLGRGLYARPDAPVTEGHALALVCAHAPAAVVCLLSALRLHGLGTQDPWQVWAMIETGARAPRMDYPPLRVVRAGGEAFRAGVEERRVEGVTVRVTGVAKTVADCFKYRSRVGLDVALEALRECLAERRASPDEIWRYARVCRVERVLRPYLEALSL